MVGFSRLLWGVVLLVLLVFAASADTFTVCPSGCNYTIIQDALGNASSGDSVSVIGNSTYYENLVIAADNITFDCQGATVDGQGGSSTVFVQDKNGVIIRNCIVTNASDCIYLYRSNSTMIAGNEVFGCGRGIYVRGGTYLPYYSFNNVIQENNVRDSGEGIRIQWSQDGIVIDNFVTGSSVAGIYLDYLMNVVDNNTVVDNIGIGIYTNGADFIIANNTLVNNSDGIYVGKPHNQTQEIVLNNITLNVGDGIHVNHASPSITYNTLYDNSENGVFLQQARPGAQPSDITYVIGNTIRNNTLDGIYAESGGKYLNISENNISRNSLRGVQLDSHSNTLEDNIITENGDSGIVLIPPYSYNNTLINNTVSNNGNNGLYILTNDTSGNLIINNHFCFNNQYDIFDNISVTTGDNNTCNTVFNYNDTSASTSGCVYRCHRSSLVTGWNLFSLPLSFT